MLCVNMIGKFEKPLIIGKAKNPHCFKNFNLDCMNITWRAKQKSWMITEIIFFFARLVPIGTPRLRPLPIALYLSFKFKGRYLVVQSPY